MRSAPLRQTVPGLRPPELELCAGISQRPVCVAGKADTVHDSRQIGAHHLQVDADTAEPFLQQIWHRGALAEASRLPEPAGQIAEGLTSRAEPAARPPDMRRRYQAFSGNLGEVPGHAKDIADRNLPFAWAPPFTMGALRSVTPRPRRNPGAP